MFQYELVSIPVVVTNPVRPTEPQTPQPAIVSAVNTSAPPVVLFAEQRWPFGGPAAPAQDCTFSFKSSKRASGRPRLDIVDVIPHARSQYSLPCCAAPTPRIYTLAKAPVRWPLTTSIFGANGIQVSELRHTGLTQRAGNPAVTRLDRRFLQGLSSALYRCHTTSSKHRALEPRRRGWHHPGQQATGQRKEQTFRDILWLNTTSTAPHRYRSRSIRVLANTNGD